MEMEGCCLMLNGWSGGWEEALPTSPSIKAPLNLVPLGGSQLPTSPEKVPRREEELSDSWAWASQLPSELRGRPKLR